jgi:hypothetical protein
MLSLVLWTVLSGLSVHDQLDGAEIGDANRYIEFKSGGEYMAEREDKKKGKTTAKGTWAVKDDQLEVKISSCKGPACDELGKGYSATLAMVAERAMTVKSDFDQGPLSSGSYYCHFQGCEKRSGVLLVTHGARANVMKYLLDFLIDKNTKRDVTVVWWGKKITDEHAASQISWCTRDADRGKKAAEQLAKDLGDLSWFGKVQPQAGDSECLYDAKVIVGDKVELPPKR